MKKIILLILLISLNGYIDPARSQSIDSISVELYKTRTLSGGPWDMQWMRSDSFSIGFLMSSLLRNWNGNGWTNDELTTYSYTGGIKSGAILQVWDTSHWSNQRNWTFISSISHDSTLSQVWNSSWMNDTLTVGYKNTIGLDSLYLVYRWMNSSWVNALKREDAFAADSTFLSQTYSSWDSTLSQWNNYRRYLWLKDSIGNDTAYITQNYVSGAWKNYYGLISTYNGHQLIQRIDAMWDDVNNSFTDVDAIITYTYDSLGRIIYNLEDYYPGGFAEQTYSYDTSGILVNHLLHQETQGGFVHEYNLQWFFFSFPNASNIYLFSYDDSIQICSNDSVPSGFFAIGGTAPLHFQWSPSNAIDNDTIESPYFLVDTNTLITVTVSDASAHSAADSIFVQVIQPPTILSVQSIAACIGCTNGMFIISSLHGTSSLVYYSVTPNSGAVISGDTIKHLAGGIYTICANDFSHCSVCITDTILEDNSFVGENIQNDLKIYPTPTAGNVTINFPENISFAEVVITNAFGQILNKEDYVNKSELQLQINGNSGMYFVRITTGKKIWVVRVVKD